MDSKVEITTGLVAELQEGLDWIWHPAVEDRIPEVVVFRRDFDLEYSRNVILKVSADQRYQLFLDGVRRGVGPERGDLQRWFYETYEFELDAGPHVLTVLAWHLPAPFVPGAQLTGSPGFLLAGSGEDVPLLNTGAADWQVCPLEGISFEPTTHQIFCGSLFTLDGAGFDYRLVTGESTAAKWQKAHVVSRACTRSNPGNPHGVQRGKWLAPAMLKQSVDKPFRASRCRWAGRTWLECGTEISVSSCDADLAQSIEMWLRDDTAVEIPPRISCSFIVQFDNYYCAYPELHVSGGAAGKVELGWSESLFTNMSAYSEAVGGEAFHKGDRNEIENKTFRGDFDRFLPGARENEVFTTLWWRAGRYLLFRIKTKDQPLMLKKLVFHETRQPVEWNAEFSSSDNRLETFIPIGRRSLQMCMHETSIDCPYYEQLQYISDARLNFLTLYLTGENSAPAKKCLLQYDESRLPSGFMRCSYPNREIQVIPGFSLWWIYMLRDYARYRRDSEFVIASLPGSRAILEAFHRHINAEGLLANLPHWNFVDWVPQWRNGVPPAGDDGASCINSLEYVEALRFQSELESSFGEPLLARLYKERCECLESAILRMFWDEARGMLSDDTEHNHFSEHCQAVALKLGVGTTKQHMEMLKGLEEDGDLSRCTIYYSWQLFEAYFACGRHDLFIERMRHWFEHVQHGLKTCAETPEPSRSDCHAWGAHPIWHYFSSLLGIRPSAWGFHKVVIQPCPGNLTRLAGKIHHPNGRISISITRENDGCDIRITLPPDLCGTLVWQGQTHSVESGDTHFHFTSGWNVQNKECLWPRALSANNMSVKST